VTSPPGFGLLSRAVSYALVSAGYATPELLPLATPCAGWDLAMLLNHVRDSLDVLHDAVGDGCVQPGPAPGAGHAGDGPAASGGYARAGPAFGEGTTSQPHAEPHAGSEPDLVRAVRRRASKLLAACATAGAGERVVAIADRHLTANVVAVTGAIEISVHGWDIGAACRRRRPIPPLLAVEMLRFAPVLIPAGTRDGLFAEPVSVPAPPGCPSDQLVAFLGRQPGWPTEPGRLS